MQVRLVGVLLGSAVAALLFASAAVAADVELTYSSHRGGSAAGYLDVNDSGTYTRIGGGGGGLFTLERGNDGSNNDFVYGFCIELLENAPVGDYYDYRQDDLRNASVDQADGAFNLSAMGVGGEEALQGLFTVAYQGANAALWTNAEAMGFQLAVWEIVYEFSHNQSFAGTLSIDDDDSGAFYLTGGGDGSSGTARHYAAEYLADLAGLSSSTTLATVVAMTFDGRQDYAILVPLPSAALMGLSLLLGIGLVSAVRRRRALA